MRYWWLILFLPVGIATFIFFGDTKNRSGVASGSVAIKMANERENNSSEKETGRISSDDPYGNYEDSQDTTVRIDKFHRTFKSAGLNWQLTAATGVVGDGGRIKLSEVDATFFKDKKGKKTEMTVSALDGVLHLVANQVEKIRLTGNVRLSLKKEKGTPLELISNRVYFEDEVLFGFNPTFMKQGVMTFVGEEGFSFFVDDELLSLRNVDSVFE